jgi:hypothetical protein
MEVYDPKAGLLADFSKSTCVDVMLWKDLSSSNLCGSSCGIAQKEGNVVLSLFGAVEMQPGLTELPLLSE